MFKSFTADYEVCTCSHVNLGEIVKFIHENKIKKLGPIQDFLKIGSGCKYCICEEVDMGKVKKKIYCKDILEGNV